MSNSFSLNQAAVIIERAPDPQSGRRFGIRLDLQYGQATETVQGNANNELRPQAYRPVWQAYGTYVVPVGDGLTVTRVPTFTTSCLSITLDCEQNILLMTSWP